MSTQEIKTLRLQIYHQVIGTQNIEVSSKDSFTDLRMMLSDNTPMTILDNFRFMINGTIVPDYQQIGQIITQDTKIILILSPFDEKSSLYHFRKIGEIFRNPIDWAILNYNKQQQQVNEGKQKNKYEWLRSQNTGITVYNFLDQLFTCPLFSVPVTELLRTTGETGTINNHQGEMSFVGFLVFSNFNACPFTSQSLYPKGLTTYSRKLYGDFYYLHLRTLQGKDYHITACPKGFFVNSSTSTHFNPQPINPNINTSHLQDCFTSDTPLYFYNLLDLIGTLSPKFRNNMRKLKQTNFTQAQRTVYSSFKNKQIQNNHHKWLIKPNNKQTYHYYNYNNSSSDTQQEKQKQPFILKDWNEIIQLQTVTPLDSIFEIINKDKYKFKFSQDLVSSVKEKAIKVIEGCIQRTQVVNQINKSGGSTIASFPIKQIYSYGCLQFWFADDTYDHHRYKSQTGLTKKAVNSQIRNLQILTNLKLTDIHFKQTMLIQYKGYNLVAQTIIPGYSSTNKNTTTNQYKRSQRIQKIMENIAKSCRLSQHILYRSCQDAVKSHPYKYKNNSEKIEMTLVNPDLKVIQANNGKDYLINLYTLSCRDLNFAGPENTGCYLRPQLIQGYYNNPTIYLTNTKNNYHKYYKIPLNTMIGSTYNLIRNDKNDDQKLKLLELSSFAKNTMVTICLKALQNQQRKYLGDSKNVVKIMHQYGLSSRYLGILWQQSIKKNNWHHMSVIIQRVTLVKALKPVIRKLMRQSKQKKIKQIIVWVFNCIFCDIKMNKDHQLNLQRHQQKQEDQSHTTISNRKRKKKPDHQKLLREQQQFVFEIDKKQQKCMQCREIWEIVARICQCKFGLEFNAGCFSELQCLATVYGKTAVLRDLCRSLGIVLEKKQYFKKNNDQLCFENDNIINIKAIVKNVAVQSDHFNKIVHEADKLLQTGKIEQSIESYVQAIQFSMSNLGFITQNLINVHKKLSQIYFRVGQIELALLFNHQIQKILEKYYGQDHVETIQVYKMLSQLYCISRKIHLSEFYMLKMLKLSIVAFGQQYPEIIPGFLNLSTIYTASQKYIDAIYCCGKALDLSIEIFGQDNMSTAICYAAMSQIHFQIPDIQKCIIFTSKSLQILYKIMKPNDARLKQAEQTLQYYKSLQGSKKIKQNHQRERKRVISQQMYTNLAFGKPPQNLWKQHEMLKKMQSYLFSTGKSNFN